MRFREKTKKKILDFFPIEYFNIRDFYNGGKYIYCIRAGRTNFYKIGISHDLMSRIDNLQTACPLKLKFISASHGSQRLEEALHKILERKGVHVRGEWFALNGNQLCIFHNLRKAIGIWHQEIWRQYGEWDYTSKCFPDNKPSRNDTPIDVKYPSELKKVGRLYTEYPEIIGDQRVEMTENLKYDPSFDQSP